MRANTRTRLYILTNAKGSCWVYVIAGKTMAQARCALLLQDSPRQASLAGPCRPLQRDWSRVWTGTYLPVLDAQHRRSCPDGLAQNHAKEHNQRVSATSLADIWQSVKATVHQARQQREKSVQTIRLVASSVLLISQSSPVRHLRRGAAAASCAETGRSRPWHAFGGCSRRIELKAEGH